MKFNSKKDFYLLKYGPNIKGFPSTGQITIVFGGYVDAKEISEALQAEMLFQKKPRRQNPDPPTVGKTLDTISEKLLG